MVLLSTEVAVIMTVPADIGVTTPVEDMNATNSLLLLHVTFLFVALGGVTLTETVPVPPPTASGSVGGMMDSPVTGIVGGGGVYPERVMLPSKGSPCVIPAGKSNENGKVLPRLVGRLSPLAYSA